ncbi:MAG: hypothetical protein VXY77_02090 [Pseudomonadota bacterium]|nr:hypothetical protein [Pseudomonadota bacterium]
MQTKRFGSGFWIMLCLILCMPRLCWASAQLYPGSVIFDDSTTQLSQGTQRDLSLRMLCGLFPSSMQGIVCESTVMGLGVGVVKTLLAYFNAGMGLLAFWLLAYWVFTKTFSMEDSQQEFSGRYSPLLVFRTVLGFILLLPQASGYSGLQNLIFWLVVQSVSVANVAFDNVFASVLPDPGPPTQLQLATALDEATSRVNMQLTQGNVLGKNEGACKASTATTMDYLSMSYCLAFWKKAENNPLILGDLSGYSFELTECNVSLGDTQYPYGLCFGLKPSGQNLCGVVNFQTDAARAVAKRTATSMLSTATTKMNANLDFTTEGFKSGTGTGLMIDGAKILNNYYQGCTSESSTWFSAACGIATDFERYNAMFVINNQLTKLWDSIIGNKEGAKHSPAYYEGWASAGRYLWTLLSDTQSVQNDCSQQCSKNPTDYCSDGMLITTKKASCDAVSQMFCSSVCLMGRIKNPDGVSGSDCPTASTMRASNTTFIRSPYCTAQVGALSKPGNQFNMTNMIDQPDQKNGIPDLIVGIYSGLYGVMFGPWDQSQSCSKTNTTGVLARVYAKAMRTSGFVMPSNDSAPSRFTTQDSSSSISACNVAKILRQGSVLDGGPSESCLLPSSLDPYVASADNSASSAVSVNNNASSNDYAFRHMMTSLYWVLSDLTGLKIYDHPAAGSSTRNPYDDDGYDILSSGKQLYNPFCACVIDSMTCGQLATGQSAQLDTKKFKDCFDINNANTSTLSGFQQSLPLSGANMDVNFLTVMLETGCLNIAPNVTKVTSTDPIPQMSYIKAGLFGQELLADNKSFLESHHAYVYDPARGAMRLGHAMISAAVFYYVKTLTKITSVLNTMSLTLTWGFGIMKWAFFMGNHGKYSISNPFFSQFNDIIDRAVNILYQVQKVGLEMYLPLGTALSGIMITQGFILAIYLPFLAYLNYSFGVISWLISVIEAMIVAPLIALGMVHPKGHDLMGQAEPSIMLMVSVLVRPLALLLGFLLAIKLSHISVYYVNSVFSYALLGYVDLMSIKNTMIGGMISGNPSCVDPNSLYARVIMVSLVGVLMVYTYIVYALLDLSYALIYQVPDRIMKWIGVNQNSSDIKERASSVKAGVQQISDSASSAGNDMESGAAGGPANISLGNEKGPPGDGKSDSSRSGHIGQR